MNKIEALDAELEKKRLEEEEINRNNFEANDTLSEEESAKLVEMKARSEEGQMVVIQKGADGQSTVPVATFTEDLDAKVALMKNMAHDPETVKLLSGSDIAYSKDKLTSDVRENVLANLSALADHDLTDAEFNNMYSDTVTAVKSYFKVDKVNTEAVVKKMSKLPYAALAGFLPRAFLETFVPKNIREHNPIEAKNLTLTAISYVMVSGPEMDNLNDYIDEVNRKNAVMLHLMQCRIDFGEVLTSEKKLSEILQEANANRVPDASVMMKYIKNPDIANNQLMQQSIVHRLIAEEYTKLLSEYPDPEDREIIQKEIDEAHASEKTYAETHELVLFKELANILHTRYTSDKRADRKFLKKEALEVIERVRRSKINLPFPAYDGKEKNPEKIYHWYQSFMVGAFAAYNTAIEATISKAAETIHQTVIDVDSAILADVILVIMGRILKRCTKNTATKFDAIIVDAYFKMFCGMAQDVFVMNDIKAIASPIVTLIEAK